jgi:hypothetical protein
MQILRRAGMRGGFVQGHSEFDAMPVDGYGPVQSRGFHRGRPGPPPPPGPPPMQRRRNLPVREPIERAMLNTTIQTDQGTGDLVVRLYETNVVSINQMTGQTVGYRLCVDDLLCDYMFCACCAGFNERRVSDGRDICPYN